MISFQLKASNNRYLRYLWIYITRKLTLPLVLSISLNIKYETRHPLIRKKVSTLTNALLTAWNSNLWLRPKRVATFDVGKPWPNKAPRMWPIITHVMERNLMPSKQDRWSPLGGSVLKSLFVLAYNPKFKNNVCVPENSYLRLDGYLNCIDLSWNVSLLVKWLFKLLVEKWFWKIFQTSINVPIIVEIKIIKHRDLKDI